MNKGKAYYHTGKGFYTYVLSPKQFSLEFSLRSSDPRIHINQVWVDGEWKTYSECVGIRYDLSPWDDNKIITKGIDLKCRSYSYNRDEMTHGKACELFGVNYHNPYILGGK